MPSVAVQPTSCSLALPFIVMADHTRGHCNVNNRKGLPSSYHTPHCPRWRPTVYQIICRWYYRPRLQWWCVLGVAPSHVLQANMMTLLHVCSQLLAVSMTAWHAPNMEGGRQCSKYTMVIAFPSCQRHGILGRRLQLHRVIFVHVHAVMHW